MQPSCDGSMEMAPMPDPADWNAATFDGNRRRQHQAFAALSFREKLQRLEEMAQVTERLVGRPAQTPPVLPPAHRPRGSPR